MLVLAGPGSGKTSVLISHIQQLITEHHAKPDEILVVTFTRAAAEEMRERFIKLSGLSSVSPVFGTLHGIFYAILRRAYKAGQKHLVAGKEKQKMLYTLLKNAGQEKQLEEQALMLEQEFSKVKNSRIFAEAKTVQQKEAAVQKLGFTPEALETKQFIQAFAAYERMLLSVNGMDFDDLAPLVERLFAEHEEEKVYWQQRFSYVLVDEFQDIDAGQYALLKVLCAPENNLFMVGDDDQSIYGFRGAAPEVMQQVKLDFPGLETVVLDMNYRCRQEIITSAGRLIRKNSVRFEKRADPARQGQGIVEGICVSGKKEEWQHLAKMILADKKENKDAKIAVLSRTKAGVHTLQVALSGLGIPLARTDGLKKLSEHFIWKDLLSYLRISEGSRRRQEYLTILNKPMRFLDRMVFSEEIVDWEHCFWGIKDDVLQKNRLKSFQRELMTIKGLVPLAALYCIKSHMGYETYIKDLARHHGKEEDSYLLYMELFLKLAAGKQSLQEYRQAVENYVWPADTNGVHISTMHAAKGLEYDVVYIVDVNEGNIPWKDAKEQKAIEEERRLLYVGMTRAKDKLCLMWVDRQSSGMSPSRFLKEAGLIREEEAYSKDKR